MPIGCGVADARLSRRSAQRQRVKALLLENATRSIEQGVAKIAVVITP
jgi:hypothetical protein